MLVLTLLQLYETRGPSLFRLFFLNTVALVLTVSLVALVVCVKLERGQTTSALLYIFAGVTLAVILILLAT